MKPPKRAEKMLRLMDRAVTGSDGEPVGCADRGGDVGLGVGDRGREIVSLGEAGGDRR